MFRNSRYAKEGSSLYLAPCGKSILQTCGGGEADQHIENCEECKNEIIIEDKKWFNMKHTLKEIVKVPMAKLVHICEGKANYQIELEDSVYNLI